MEILIKIKIEGNSNAHAFVEQTQPYLSKTFNEIRQDIVSEVGELLPQNFKIVRTGISVSAIQEEKLHLQNCIGEEEENGKVFVHNSSEKKDSREISTQSSSSSKRAHILKTQCGGDTVAHLFPRENNGTRPKNNLKIVFICNNYYFYNITHQMTYSKPLYQLIATCTCESHV